MNGLNTLLNAMPLLVITVLGGWLLNGRLNRIERKLDSLPTREEFNALVHRVDRHDDRFDRVDDRFDRVDDRFDRVDERFDRLDSKFDGIRSDLTQIAIALGTRPKPQAG